MGKQEILLESGTNEMELLAFLLGEQVFGVNVAKVQSIQQFKPSQLTKIPLSHPAMMGMIIHRERTIPLINLAASLELKIDSNNDSATRIVIVTEFNNSVNGFLVDGVERIHRLFWSDFVPIGHIVDNAGAGVTGSIHIEGKEIMVIDMEHILSLVIPNLAIRKTSHKSLGIPEEKNRKNISIFFAEDSQTIRKNVFNILTDSGFTNIRTFNNGLEAFNELTSIRNQIEEKSADSSKLPHLLISDIEMPQMDGLTLCKKVKTDDYLEQIKVIMFSSLINKQMITKCESVGADRYITKPEMKKLIQMIDDMCLQK